VFRPDLRPRVKQRAELSGLWIEGGEVSPLVTVTTPTGERQVIYVGGAAVLLRYNVIHFVWVEGDFCREQAVLATVPRPLDDFTAQGAGTYVTRRAPPSGAEGRRT
jgi:hypothetical protein